MKPVLRSDILDYVTYTEQRTELQKNIFKIKAVRRIHVGEYLTFLFENTATAHYQIQEIMRVERMVKEQDILHEIESNNQLLGNPGELGCVLLIEIDDVTTRDIKLRQWIDLPKHLYLRLTNGQKIRPSFEAQQISDGRLSAVQYLKFDTQGAVPEALGSDLPELTVETILNGEQKNALAEDLK